MTAPLPIDAGPCPWPLDTSCDPKWQGYPEALQQRAVKLATQILWAFSGYRYGLCPITVRPCTGPQRCGLYRPAWYGTWGSMWGGSTVLQPWIDRYGNWRNGCGGCASECGCSPECVIRLEGPVHQVLEVLQAGTVVPDTQWVVYDTDTGTRLMRTGGGCWLECQELAQPDDGAQALAVTYTRGQMPAGADAALGLLASELAKACADAGACRLPKRVSTIVREGITYTMLDPLTLFKEGRTGLPEVDMWLASVNPYGGRAGAVFSPDIKRGYQVRQSNPSPWRTGGTP